MEQKKNVFVLGLEEFNLAKLNRLPEARECRFLPALKFSEIRGVENISIKELLDLIDERIRDAGSIDAIVSYWDFPGTILVPIVAKKYGLFGPSLESILKCEHKYWSRLEQQKVIPGNIPHFKAFDPFDEDSYEQINFMPPFWIKPIKSFHSFLAYRVNDPSHFSECNREVCEHINYISEPFSYILREYVAAREFGQMKESMIAETMIAGHQCTVEGYSFGNEVVVYGIVDSVREEDRSSFSRYEYPSSLPQEIQFRMVDLARRVIEEIGLENSAFNIEFFYNETANQIYLLEINPRISQAHTDLFEKVHGVSHHQIMLNLALNRRPKSLTYNGDFRVAAHFMLRTFHPGFVLSAPLNQEIEHLKTKYPELEVQVNVKEGMDLNEMGMHHLDSYSFILANVFLGGRNRDELLEKYNDVTDHLNFKVESFIKV